MFKKISIIIIFISSFYLFGIEAYQLITGKNLMAQTNHQNEYPVKKTNEEWREILTDEEYRVLREKGTERAGTGEYDKFFEKGKYTCKACNTVLFESDTKFDAHCGWPSFYKAIDKSKVKEITDYSHGMIRTEVLCANCGGHLGHVFPDGPKPTGMRYCINSVSISFVPDSSK